MPHTKELSEDPRSKMVGWHEAGRGHERICKSLDVRVSTVRQTIYKWRKYSTIAALPAQVWSSCHDGLRVHGRRLLIEVKKNQRMSSKDLQKSLAHAHTVFGKSTASKTFNKNSWEDTREEAIAEKGIPKFIKTFCRKT